MQQISSIQREQLLLWYLLQHSTSSYYKLMGYFGSAHAAIQPSAITVWQQLKLHANHIKRLQHFDSPQGQIDAESCLKKIEQCTDHILFYDHHISENQSGAQIPDVSLVSPHYPASLLPYENSPPILFVCGNPEALQRPQIAMVGSRKPSPHGAQVAYDFAHYFAELGYVVTSGLAVGIDTAAHHGAVSAGQSVAIIATGLDQCYPAENQGLWQQIITTGGAIVTEFLPGTPPRKEYFPRRNHIISGLSAGTLVVEAGLSSGSLITAKAAAEQGKQVFAIPGHIYSQFHQGCHQLIRDGATLVDHPTQVIEDLHMFHSSMPTLNSPSSINTAPSESVVDTTPKSKIKFGTSKAASTAKSTGDINARVAKPAILQHPSSQAEPQVPEHLIAIYQALDWVGISLDELSLRLTQDVSALNIALVELELLGLCKQHAGRYLRCNE